MECNAKSEKANELIHRRIITIHCDYKSCAILMRRIRCVESNWRCRDNNLQEMNDRSLGSRLMTSERSVLTVFRTRDYLQARPARARKGLAIIYCSNLKHSIIIYRFKFGLDIFRFEAFESQKSNHPVLFHLILFSLTLEKICSIVLMKRYSDRFSFSECYVGRMPFHFPVLVVSFYDLQSEMQSLMLTDMNVEFVGNIFYALGAFPRARTPSCEKLPPNSVSIRRRYERDSPAKGI
jgi:hypothetical protein